MGSSSRQRALGPIVVFRPRQVHAGRAPAGLCRQLAFLVLLTVACQEDPALARAPAAAAAGGGFSLSLDGGWTLLVDPGDVGLQDGWVEDLTAGGIPAGAPSGKHRMPVPGPLEGMPGTAFYDGVVWYRRWFATPRPTAGLRCVLRFEQVNWSARVWIDGEEVGRHEGGYAPFEFDVTGRLDDGRRHMIVVRVLDPGALRTDGVTLATTPHAKESWYHNFGGLLGSVTLRAHAGIEARLLATTPDPGSGQVEVRLGAWSAPSGGAGQARFSLAVERLPLGQRPPGPGEGELPVVAAGSLVVPLAAGAGEASQTLTVPAPARWSPASPALYRLLVTGPDGARQDFRTFGFRSVRLDAEGLHLDGVRRVPKGVLYQPHDTGLPGMSPGEEALEAEVLAMKEAGFDLVRAHVRPAWPAFLDAADRHGLLVLEEPAIGWVQDDPGLAERLRREVEWMVERDAHHPSIVLWGVLNELSGEAYRYGPDLALRLAQLDATRPVLVDSGGFFGASYVPAGGSALLPMVDEHLYPPCPLPPAELARLRTIAADDGPTFVSEYGYGTILDAARAARPFVEGGYLGEERSLFAFYAEGQRRALEGRHGWRAEGWLQEAQRLQGEMAARMTEALRANPALDLLCFTQWRAVSHESSAGLLAPWGERRPAHGAMQAALDPRLLALFPGRPSIHPDEAVEVDVVLVNEGRDLTEAVLELTLEGGLWERNGQASLVMPVAVDTGGAVRLRERLRPAGAAPAGVGLGGVLRDGGALLTSARQATVAVVPRPGAAAPEGSGPPVLLPEGDPALRSFARRQGFPEAVGGLETEPAVILLARPEALAERVPLEERLRLWRRVWLGGSAVVLLNDLAEDDIGRIAGRVRGTRTLTHVPVRLGIASAPGNFMGRFHVALEAPPGSPQAAEVLDPLVFEGDGGGALGEDPAAGLRPRLLGMDDGVLSPASMLVGELPEGSRRAMVTLGEVGSRLGAPVALVPFGSGQMLFVGLPLLEPVDGATDARRDALLAWLVRRAAQEARGAAAAAAAEAPPWVPLDPALASQLEFGLTRLARVAAFWDRYSAVFGGEAGGAGMPRPTREALRGVDRATVAFALGRHEEGRELMLEAYGSAWNDETAAILANDEVVLGLVHRVLGLGTPRDLDLAYQALVLWRSALAAWAAGDGTTAQQWLGRAELLLRSSGRVPASREEGAGP